MIYTLATGVHRGDISASQLVTRMVTRVRSHDAAIGAVTYLDEDSATRQGEAIDALDDSQRRGLPLAGIPVLVKDTDDVAGWRTTYGSVPFHDNPMATSDSPVVSRLRAAGAIAVGRTNTCEFAHEGYTCNRLYGPTRNPWNLAWSPGGSSGGSAAALASGMAPLVTGSDGGGSIRIPASLCGLLGLKPTTGLIWPAPNAPWLDVHTDGVLATTARDLDLLFAVLRGGDVTDIERTTARRPHITRLLVAERLGPEGRPDELGQRLLHDAAAMLADELGVGMDIVTVESLLGAAPELPERWDEDWYDMTSAEHAWFIGQERYLRHLDEWDDSFRTSLDHGFTVSMEGYLGARRRARETTRHLRAALTPGTVLLAPVVSGPGYYPDGIVAPAAAPGSPPGLTHTVLANLTGQPAISLPAGLGAAGLPSGVQAITAHGQDDTLIALAHLWEHIKPWPTVAPGFRDFGQD